MFWSRESHAKILSLSVVRAARLLLSVVGHGGRRVAIVVPFGDTTARESASKGGMDDEKARHRFRGRRETLLAVSYSIWKNLLDIAMFLIGCMCGRRGMKPARTVLGCV